MNRKITCLHKFDSLGTPAGKLATPGKFCCAADVGIYALKIAKLSLIYAYKQVYMHTILIAQISTKVWTL